MEQMSSYSGVSFPLKDRFNQKAHAKIRLAKTSDADFIAQLSRNVFRIYGPYEDAVSQWFESDLTKTLMALVDGKYVGFATIGHLDDDRNLGPVSELLAIAVEPGKQRMGIGERLLMEIERKAAELKVKRLFLHTARENLSAQKLFTGNGYHPWGLKRNFYPAGQDAVLMSKEIDGEGEV
jgi:ribosomal protein S18 acetylase RimI-like enzyme